MPQGAAFCSFLLVVVVVVVVVVSFPAFYRSQSHAWCHTPGERVESTGATGELLYSYFNWRCRIKASTLHDKTEWWSGYLMKFAYQCRGEIMFLFLYMTAWAWKQCVCSHDSFSPSFNFTVYTVLVWKIPLKLIVALMLCVHRSEEKGKMYGDKYIYFIHHVKQPSTSTHTTIRSFRVSLKLWSDNVNWNSCIRLHAGVLDVF